MKVKIIIMTRKIEEAGFHRSEVWSGEMEILDPEEYLVKISVIEEGTPQPIVDIPFSKGIGHYVWVPPDDETNRIDDGWNFN